MALPKENPEVENQLEGFVSQPDESAASAATQLEPFLNLLLELKIIAGSKQQNSDRESDSNSENDRAGALDGLMDLLPISSAEPEEITTNAPSNTRSPQSEADSNSKNHRAATSGGLIDLSGISQQEQEEIAAQQNPDSESYRSGKKAQAGALGGLMDLLGISEREQEEIAASIPHKTASVEPQSTNSPAVTGESKSLLFPTHKLNSSELEKNYSSAKTIDISADVSEFERESPDLTISDSPQYLQAEKSQDLDTALEDLSGQTLQPPAATNPNATLPTIPEQSEKKYLDAVVTSLPSMSELQEQPTPISQRAEILGEIKQDLNEADNAMERLQSLIFGSQISDIEQVKNLLAQNDLPGVRHLLTTIDDKLGKLEHQIHDPQELIALMLPWIAEILSRKITDSRQEVVNAIVPIIDEVIRAKTVENRPAMSSAIAELLPDALAEQIKNSPAEIAKAIAPEIGLAIKEQIRLDQESIAQALAPEMGKAITAQIKLERDAMVDALYPVIGSTISRYMAEAIKTINEKVSNAMSVEGFQRKIRSKVQGVSEAELILKESVP
ncbi:MAG: flagellar motor protein MotB, partial [Microcoleus sp.]